MFPHNFFLLTVVHRVMPFSIDLHRYLVGEQQGGFSFPLGFLSTYEMVALSKRMLILPPGSSCKKFSVQKIILGKKFWLDIGERKRMRRFATRLLGHRLSYSRFLLGRHLDIQNTYSYIPHHHSQFQYLIFWGLGSLLEFQYLSFSFVSIPPRYLYLGSPSRHQGCGCSYRRGG